MIIPVLWALLGGSLAVNFEFWVRRGGIWWNYWWWAVPTAVLIQLSVYHLMRSNLGWLPAVVLFSGTTAVARIGLTFFVLHEPLSVPNVVAGAMLLGAVAVKLVWR